MIKKALLFMVAALLAILIASCGKKDPFADSIYKEQPEIGLYQDYLVKTEGLPADGTDGILNSGSEKGMIEKRGLQFKDSDDDGELDPYEDWRLPARERAADLVRQMSVEDKLGLLNFTGAVLGGGNKNESEELNYGIPGLESDGTIMEEDDAGKATLARRISSEFLRYSNTDYKNDPVDQVKYFNNIQGLCERSDWGVPYYMTTPPWQDLWDSNEIDISKRSPWPFLMGFGAINDLSVTKKFGEIIRAEIRMRGAHGVWGPQADLATEPRWARIQHAIAADQELAASHIGVMVKAIQGGSTLQPDAIASWIKHFPGAGSAEKGMDSHTYAGRYSIFPGGRFEDHLAPFKAAIEANVSGVMACYSIFDIDEYKDVEDGVPVEEGAAFSTKIMTDLLKNELGFDGAIVSDQLNGDKISWGHTEESVSEIVADLLNAGTYQYLPGDLNAWLEAYDQGMITVEKIDDAVIHTLELQFKLGLFENPYVDVAEAEIFWDPEGSAMKKRVRAGIMAMKKAIVLAKNESLDPTLDVLPIKGANEAYLSYVDTNGNGTIDVYFDSPFPNADSGQADSYASHANGKYLKTNFVADIDDADVAIVRITSRGGTYFGTQGPVPLDFDSPAYPWDHETRSYRYEAIENFSDMGNWIFGDQSDKGGSEVDWYRGVNGTGYRTWYGYNDSIAIVRKAMDAGKANPGLKIVVGMTASRPGIVSSFIDEIDGFLIDFAATDDAFLDVVFQQGGFAPNAKLPVEFPSSNESLDAQSEDVAGDTPEPLFEMGFGLKYKASGYGT